MNKLIHRFCTLLFVLAFAFSNVSAQHIVKNTGKGKWGNNPKTKIELIKKIGEIDAEDENYLLYMPSDITKDKDGNMYILDAGNFQVKKFDAAGKFLLSFGEEGQGPGEFARPGFLFINAEHNVVIADAGNKKFEVFSAKGERITNYALEDVPGGGLVTNEDQLLVAGGSSLRLMLAELQGGSKKKANPTPVLEFIDYKTGEKARKIGEHEDYGDMMTNRTINAIYYDIDPVNNIVVAYAKKNRIEKYSPDGKLLFIADRPLNYEETEPQKGSTETASAAGGGKMMMFKMPDMNTISKAIAADTEGRLWVVTLNRQMKDEERVGMSMRMGSGGSMSTSLEGNTDLTETDMYDLEIFSKNGELLGKIKLNHFVDGMKIIDDKLYILDKMRGMQYYEYQIVNN